MTVKATPVPLLQRVYHRYAGASRKDALNLSDEPGGAGSDVIFELKQVINALKLDAFDTERGTVDYRHLRESQAYRNYQRITHRLASFPLKTLVSQEERLAFWINLYNTLIVDAVIRFGVQKSVQEVRGFFVKAAYVVDGYRFSADDIEHGVLRANAGHPAIPGAQFRFNDPRYEFALREPDPRIHFTLVCASASCPPIGVYSVERIDEQLDMAARNFINGGEAVVDLDNDTVTLSKIFQWFAPDFGGPALNQIGFGSFEAVLAFIAPYMDDAAARDALTYEPERFKVQFVSYDWGLNLVA